MALLATLKQKREAALAKSEEILKIAETTNRQLTEQESKDIDACMVEVNALGAQIKQVESVNTLRGQFPTGQVIVDEPRHTVNPEDGKKTFSKEYLEAFRAYLRTGGQEMQAALVEGTNSAGGFAVPITVDSQIVPLAPLEMAVRRLVTVIPTTNDIKFPQKASQGTAAAKAEGSSFAGTAPTLGQFTLSAFMAGVTDDISWELAQDVPAFQAFVTDDILLAQAVYEENLYINGSGSGEAQGLVANVDNGVAAAVADSNGNLLSIDCTFDVMGVLNAVYHPNATWLMSRATSIELRKAQKQSNLFEPVFTRVGNQDFLHSYPVEYSSAMPAIAAGATPVVFGDFKRAYIIGDRGGSGISVKVLDQPKAYQGLISLLAYRRTDGRVRRSEACKSITLHT